MRCSAVRCGSGAVRYRVWVDGAGWGGWRCDALRCEAGRGGAGLGECGLEQGEMGWGMGQSRMGWGGVRLDYPSCCGLRQQLGAERSEQ